MPARRSTLMPGCPSGSRPVRPRRAHPTSSSFTVQEMATTSSQLRLRLPCQLRLPRAPRAGLPGTIPPSGLCGAGRRQQSTRAWPTWQRRAERSRPWPIFAVPLPSSLRAPWPRRLSTGSGFTIRTSRLGGRKWPGLRLQRPRPRWTRVWSRRSPGARSCSACARSQPGGGASQPRALM